MRNILFAAVFALVMAVLAMDAEMFHFHILHNGHMVYDLPWESYMTMGQWVVLGVGHGATLMISLLAIFFPKSN